MAKIKEKVIGKISGTMGDFVGRIRNGNNYLSMRPSNVRVNNDPSSIERREKFRMACKLAKEIVGIDDLRSIWNAKKGSSLSAYNYAVQKNYPFVQSNQLSQIVMLAPEFGFPISAETLTINNSSINVVISALGNAADFNFEVESKIVLYGFLFLSAPTSNLVEDYFLIKILFGEHGLVTDEAINFTYSLNGTQSALAANYNSKKLYLIAVTKSDDNQIGHFSNTISGG
ncbi:MAG: hypothetical protein IPM32_17030 [Ignavibacteriae bacterium]|nr:hypothetical protein [Ignavibacteriota bacterium]